MEDSTLEKYFDDLAEKIDSLKTDLEKYDERQRVENGKVIIIEERQETMRKNIHDHKINVRWGIGVVMPAITATFLFIINIFLSKQ